MMLEGTNSSTAISWVREDLDDCLTRVRENLELFANDTSKRKALSEVQECLEQLHLTFNTMGQVGASMLTDEMIAKEAKKAEREARKAAKEAAGTKKPKKPKKK